MHKVWTRSGHLSCLSKTPPAVRHPSRAPTPVQTHINSCMTCDDSRFPGHEQLPALCQFAPKLSTGLDIQAAILSPSHAKYRPDIHVWHGTDTHPFITKAAEQNSLACFKNVRNTLRILVFSSVGQAQTHLLGFQINDWRVPPKWTHTQDSWKKLHISQTFYQDSHPSAREPCPKLFHGSPPVAKRDKTETRHLE